MERTVLFDLDGTLTDPRIGITRCINHALDQMGIECRTEEDLLWCIGPPLLGSFAALVGEERAPLALKLYRERFAGVGLYENAVYPGVPEMLVGLSEQSISLHVATSKPQPYAERILNHFGLNGHFASIHGSTLQGERTDKGELIRHIVSEERLDPRSTVMVGDREHDMIGASAAGIAGIGVLYGYGSREELIRAGARVISESPTGIPSAVQAALGGQ